MCINVLHQQFIRIMKIKWILHLSRIKIKNKDQDQPKTLLLKNESLKVDKTSLFNQQKTCLSAANPATKLLNGLIIYRASDIKGY